MRALVDTPVRGFVYERAGTVAEERLAAGEEIVREAGDRWRIPVAIVTASPDSAAWQQEMAIAASRLWAGG
jgi:hypothetical protein